MERNGETDLLAPEVMSILIASQNWTGVVKGRILVHALREHYYNQDDTVVVSPDATAIGDKWAMDYLNVAWLSPILEAMDDDVSGYISVSEVNRFMQRLPQDLGWRSALCPSFGDWNACSRMATAFQRGWRIGP